MSEQDQKHLSPAQLAEREDVSVETVYWWNKSRTGPQFMKIGRHVRYRLADVIAWEEARTVATRDPRLPVTA